MEIMSPNYIFTIMPIEAFMDARLSKTELRVLGAILSFRNKDTNLCWPSREQISERCRIPLCKISTATTSLVNLGWLKKQGNGGKSSHCKYALCVPDLTSQAVTDLVTVTDSVTVTDIVTQTVTELVTHTVTDLVTDTVTDSVRGNKQTIEQTIEQTNKEKINKKEKSSRYPNNVIPKNRKTDWVNPNSSITKPSDVPDQIWIDFLILRKHKKAPVTETALQGIRREANKAGITLADALVMCCQGGWQGFKAHWVTNEHTSKKGNQKFDAFNYINGGDGYGNKREQEIRTIDINGEVVDENEIRKIGNTTPF